MDHPLTAVQPRSLLPKRIVVGAGSHARMREALSKVVPNVEWRGNTHTMLTQDDLDWADTYVGFRRPPVATMGGVRWVHCTGAGVDSWLYPAPLPADILLTRTSESFGPMIAEWALARALAFTQRLATLGNQQAAHEWKEVDVSFVRGTRAVIVGTGDVGAHIGKAFGSLGCRVHGVSRSGRGDPAVFAEASTMDALPRLVESADWLIVALPLTDDTRSLIDRRLLLSCRGAFLMNVGRGAVLDESAIPEALDAGALTGAALDVFAVEPLPASSPLWGDPRVMVSPHISGPTTIDGAVAGFVECLQALERNEWPSWTVDRVRGY